MFKRLMNNQQQQIDSDRKDQEGALDQLRSKPIAANIGDHSENAVISDEKDSTMISTDEYEPLMELLPKSVRNKARISLKLIWHKLDMDRNSLRLRSKNGELSSHIIDVLYWSFATGIVASKLERPIEGPEIIRLMHKSGVPTSFYKNRLIYLDESKGIKITSKHTQVRKKKSKKTDSDIKLKKWLLL